MQARPAGVRSVVRSWRPFTRLRRRAPAISIIAMCVAQSIRKRAVTRAYWYMAQMGLATTGRRRHGRSASVVFASQQDCMQYRLSTVHRRLYVCVCNFPIPACRRLRRREIILYGNIVANRTDNKAKLRDTKPIVSAVNAPVINSPLSYFQDELETWATV